MKPKIICHMIGSIDGRLHPSRFTTSPDGAREDWAKVYEKVHSELGGDGWLVGRVTMAEMSTAAPHPPAAPIEVDRPVHLARRAESYAIALDRSGRLHFSQADIGGDHVVVLLGCDIADAHLAELAGDGVSYIVAADQDMTIAPMLETLHTHFGVDRLLLEGGAEINGSLIAAGLVDEFSVIVAPAIDGGEGVQGIVSFGAGLAGKAQLSLISAETLEYGTVHLRYRVAAA